MKFREFKDKLQAAFAGFVFGRGGATSIEYALIGGLIALAIIAGATLIGSSLSDTYSSVADNLT